MVLFSLLLLVGINIASGSTQWTNGFVDAQANLRQLDDTAPIVDLGYARYQGFVEANVTNFFGIRYAAQPLGDLRFRAPEAPLETSDLQQADTQPPNCPWGYYPYAVPGAPVYPQSEDCLFLNVYVPGVIDPNKKLPVIVWIHGGGYMVGGLSGYGLQYIQRGDDLVRESGGDVVVVAIQYRLGMFGFLSGEEVKAGGALNPALLDQQYALDWVQKHVSKFGGDPGHVTLWGQSAGAGSIIQHIIANGGKTTPPLFKIAMTSSAFLPSQYAYNDPILEAQYKEIVTLANCSSSQDTLQCLRTSDFDVLQNVYLEITKKALSTGTYAFAPVVDGTFITQRPTQALRQGKVNGEALYSVFNSFEGLDPSTAVVTDISEYVSNIFPKLSKQEVSAAVSIYAGLGAPSDQAFLIQGESTFICPTYYILRAFPGHDYKGEFAIPPGTHGMDLGYYFPSSNFAGVPDYNNTDFNTAFVDSFLTFAKTSNPNKKSGSKNITPFWAKWSPGNHEMLFNKTEDGAPVVKSFKTSKDLLDRCAFWESVSVNTPQ